MPFLAVSRAGVSDFVLGRPDGSSLWIGSDVLSDIEIQELRSAGLQLTVFTHSIRTAGEVSNAILVLREHHPAEPVWVEATPEKINPRSADFGQAFLWREFIVGVEYRHNEFVEVMSGPSKGERGSLVSLNSLVPVAEFTLEAESGQDLIVTQSQLLRPNA